MSHRPDAGAERGVWKIEKVVPGGDGLAHLADGRVAFVTGAFPGDTIVPLAVEAKKGYVRATRFELVSRSADREAKPCPVADACGGCDWMGLSRSSQLVQKERLLRDALERTGGIVGLPDPLPFTASDGGDRYRTRVRLQVAGDGRIGFFARGTRTLVEIPGCAVCRPEIDDTLALLRRVPRDALAALSEIEIRCADVEPRVSVLLVPRVPGGAAPTFAAVRAALPGADVAVRGEVSADSPVQRYPLPRGAHLDALPGVFTQVNWGVNVALVEAVVAGAEARGVKRFLDAFAGAGNFSLSLLATGMVGTSVERDARAVECARSTAARLGLSPDGFVLGDAAKTLRELGREGRRYDLVLLDPPRSGAKDVLESVVQLAPPVVALCSCDPVTLARDLGTLVGRGYRLDELRGFDMFPHTHHLEALAWTTRLP